MLFTFTLPETTNQAYATNGGRWYKTKKVKEWETEAGWVIKKVWKRQPIKGEVFVSIVWYLKRDRDIDGGIKPILDLLQRLRIYSNDSQVMFMNVRKNWDKKSPRVEVEVEEMA